MSFEQNIQSYNYLQNQDIEHFIHSKTFSLPFVNQSSPHIQTKATTDLFSDPYTVTSSRMSYK